MNHLFTRRKPKPYSEFVPRSPSTRLKLEALEARELPATPVIPLDNFGKQGFTRRGFEDGALAGNSVAGAGDFNGDGYADVIIGAPLTNAGGSNRGEAYVVFGGPGRYGEHDTLDHNTQFANGFTIRGFEDGAQAGISVAGTGDVNGDGYDDVIVGAIFTNAGGTDRGAAYVVFGGSNLANAAIILNNLGADGFTLRGFENGAEAGSCVAGAGDVNGDGYADIIVGAPKTNFGGTDRGAAYVIFGGAQLGGATIALNALGTGGFTVNGATLPDSTFVGSSVSAAGDVNGDGYGDIIIGAPALLVPATNAGLAVVVWGGANLGGQTFDVNNFINDGFFGLLGGEAGALVGRSVSGAGDVNGDGYADLIVGAPSTDASGTDRGEAYVIFGGAGLGGKFAQPSSLGAGGFTLRGFENYSDAGFSVSGAGDVNGDGFADLIVGARFTDAGGTDRGVAYVVFGGSALGNTTIKLLELGNRGFRLRGFEDSAQAGASVSAAGDVNGDGFADLIVGAPLTDAGGSNRGEAYIIFAPLPPIYAVGTGPGVTARVNVYDAKSGEIRTTIQPYGNFAGGVRVATGDINGDGADDIITAPGPGGGSKVLVFDGRTFAQVASFDAYGLFNGGVFVAAGDINNDGLADIVTGVGAGGGPHVKAFSGANLSTLLASFFAYNAAFTGGVNIAVGDINGDDKADIITGVGSGGGPHVKAFSGANLSTLLASFFAYSSTFTGGVNVSAGDVNGDGEAEIITGSGAGGGPHVKVFSHTGALLQSFFAYTPQFAGGVTVAARDVDGDGRADIVTGAGAGGGPHVKAFRGIDRVPLRSFFAFDAGFLGGVFVG